MPTLATALDIRTALRNFKQALQQILSKQALGGVRTQLGHGYKQSPGRMLRISQGADTAESPSSAFHLAAHNDFVPVNASPCLEAMQSLGILSIQRVSLLATGGRKRISFIAPNPPLIIPFGPAALQGDRPGPSMPSPAFRVSNPPVGSPLFLVNPPGWSWEPKCAQETSLQTTSSC